MGFSQELLYQSFINFPSPPNFSIASFFAVEHFMNLACSSVFSGGGTNQELALHCLHECGGNILVSKETS